MLLSPPELVVPPALVSPPALAPAPPLVIAPPKLCVPPPLLLFEQAEATSVAERKKAIDRALMRFMRYSLN
jgi:hypothetical protein